MRDNRSPKLPSGGSTQSLTDRIHEIEVQYDERLRKAGIERFVPVDDPRREAFHQAWFEYREAYDAIIATLPKPPPVPPGWEGAPPDKPIDTLDDLRRFVELELQRVQSMGRTHDYGRVFTNLGGESLLNAHRWLLWVRLRERPFPKRPVSADDAERELADLLVWLEVCRKRVPGNQRLTGDDALETAQPPSLRCSPVTVDIGSLTATFIKSNKTIEIRSRQSAKYLKVLADNPGKWITGSELDQYDPDLDGARTDRLRKGLPPKLQSLIETSTRKGSRLKLA